MIKIVYEEQNLRTAAYDGDTLAGQCTYVVRDGLWDLEHTIVDPAYGGQGLAGKLGDELVQKAREKGVKIVPTCSYALKTFEKNAEYADVWAK